MNNKIILILILSILLISIIFSILIKAEDIFTPTSVEEDIEYRFTIQVEKG